MRLPDGTEHIGYPIRVFVADSEDKAQAEGHNFFWQNGAFQQAAARVDGPPGYVSVDFAGIRRMRVVGTPDQVIEKLCLIRNALGVGQMCMWAQDDHMSGADRLRCIGLFGNEVLPALRSDVTAQLQPA